MFRRCWWCLILFIACLLLYVGSAIQWFWVLWFFDFCGLCLGWLFVGLSLFVMLLSVNSVDLMLLIYFNVV